MRCNQVGRKPVAKWRPGKWIVLIGCALTLPALAADDAHFRQVIERAKQLAQETYQAPEETLPEVLRELDYDTYRQIRFDPEHAYWKDESPFNLQLFHSGFLFQTPIALNVIENDTVTPLPFSAEDYTYDGNAAALKEQDLAGSGHAGFRLHYPLNSDDYADEFGVFLGASYFRIVGRDQAYGLSTAGWRSIPPHQMAKSFRHFASFGSINPRLMPNRLNCWR